ncbi:unnamed protein product [Effrenium voratum]|nr:unnamed protein product [Effrenium voratum]
MKRPLQERLEQNSALARWGKTEEVYGRAGRNWKKVQEFLSATKQVKQSHTVMQIWLQVHKENAQKRLEEALTDFLQGDALPEVELEEAVEIFKAVEEETTPGPEETVDIHAFAKQAENTSDALTKPLGAARFAELSKMTGFTEDEIVAKDLEVKCSWAG